MNNPFDLFHEHPADQHDNPFAEPRTVPGGWDTAGFARQDLTRGAAASERASEVQLMIDVPLPDHLEKFPKPRTTPKHWDVSALK